MHLTSRPEFSTVFFSYFLNLNSIRLTLVLNIFTSFCKPNIVCCRSWHFSFTVLIFRLSLAFSIRVMFMMPAATGGFLEKKTNIIFKMSRTTYDNLMKLNIIGSIYR